MGATDISAEYLKTLWEQQEGICPLTGWHLKLPATTSGWTRKAPDNASLDRIDSSKGYLQGNVRFVSVIANYARNDFSDDNVLSFCSAVVEHRRAPGRPLATPSRIRDPRTRAYAAGDSACWWRWRLTGVAPGAVREPRAAPSFKEHSMKKSAYDCVGIRVGPWDGKTTGANSPSRAALDPMPYRASFAAAVWRVNAPRADPSAGYSYFWCAGPLSHGEASSIEDGQTKADASLREQGFVVPGEATCSECGKPWRNPVPGSESTVCFTCVPF
jgi:hypothetical protein